MSKITLRTALFALFMAVVPGMFGQVSTGIPNLGSFSSGPDFINLGNLNSHFVVPVLSKPGRGLPFFYHLSLDSSVWYPVGSAGAQTWTPVPNWGWRAQTEVAVGYLSYGTSLTKCFDDPTGWYWGNRPPTGSTTTT